MTFNKKRQCCCGVDTGPKYLEVFPHIDSLTSEKGLPGTYSYWIFLGDVANQPGTTRPAYDTVIFEVNSGTTNTSATSDITYIDFEDTVLVTTGKFDCAKSGQSTFNELTVRGDNGLGLCLARRGFTWSHSSRFITESALAALNENRVIVESTLPWAGNPIDGYDKVGYAFSAVPVVGGSFYDLAPAVSHTMSRSDGETFVYEIYPAISANLPEVIKSGDDTWFDFTATFPDEIDLTYSGDITVRGPISDVSSSFTIQATYEKKTPVVNDSFSSFGYEYKEDNGDELPDDAIFIAYKQFNYKQVGSVNVPKEGGGVFPCFLAFQPWRQWVFQHATAPSGSPWGESEVMPLPFAPERWNRQAGRLKKNISQNLEANFTACVGCNVQATKGIGRICTPQKYEGIGNTNKNYNHFLNNFRRAAFEGSATLDDSNNSTGGEIVRPNDLTVPPLQSVAPIISWSAPAGSSSVTLELTTFGGSPITFYPDFPNQECSFSGVVPYVDASTFPVGDKGIGVIPHNDMAGAGISNGISGSEMYISSLS